MNPAEYDRRSRAAEAMGAPDGVQLVERALRGIESAITVKISEDVLTAAWREYERKVAPLEGWNDPEFFNILYAAMEAAGLVVED